MIKFRIIASYATCCFCEKPELKTSKTWPWEPRRELAKAAKEFCTKNNLSEFMRNKYGVGTAKLDFPCAHYLHQIVRLNWKTL